MSASSSAGPGFPSPNSGLRRGGVRPSLIILHYTAMESCEAARARLCDPAAEVSSHWLISETGICEQLVDEADRAWHAGASHWRGLEDINSHSIGIELANRGDHPFPDPQMKALERLLGEIMARWQISASAVLAHSDVAPGRKQDPGRRFDWQRLARQGLALGTDSLPQARDALSFEAAMTAIGYDPAVAAEERLAAFRLRFRPAAVGGEEGPGAEDLRLAQAIAGLEPRFAR